MTPFIQIKKLIRRYPVQNPGSHLKHTPPLWRTVLHLDSLDIHAGEILGIFGHNGSGKSTLLRLLALLEEPDEGGILFDGEPAALCDLALRREVTLLLQTPYLLSRSVFENILYGLHIRSLPSSVCRKRAFEALEAVGLDPDRFATRRRHELSGGESQRVALAARLALHPRLLLMDEPTASVDTESAERIALAVRVAAARNAAIVIVSHDREWLEPLAHRSIRLQDGIVAPDSAGGGWKGIGKGRESM